MKSPSARKNKIPGATVPNATAQSEEFEFSALAQAFHYPRAIVGEFRPFLHGSLIDVGAGIGQLTELLAQEVDPRRLQALEPDPRFAARFRSRLPDLNLLELTSAAMPAETRCETVTSINVLEHIEEDVHELKNYRRWLADSSGFLCLLVPARPELYAAIDRDFSHFRRYTRPSRIVTGKHHHRRQDRQPPLVDFSLHHPRIMPPFNFNLNLNLEHRGLAFARQLLNP